MKRDDLCDLCMCSRVSVERTTYCGKTIGIECGCDEANENGICDDPDCGECQEEMRPDDQPSEREEFLNEQEIFPFFVSFSPPSLDVPGKDVRNG